MPRRPRTRSSRRLRAVSSESTRRYPRLTDLPIEAGFRLRSAGTKSGLEEEAPEALIAAHLRDLSPEGACIEIEGKLEARKRDWLTLRLNIEDQVFDLPAVIAWVSKEDGGTAVGLELHLEVAPANVRMQYARWIVSAIQSSTAP